MRRFHCIPAWGMIFWLLGCSYGHRVLGWCVDLGQHSLGSTGNSWLILLNKVLGEKTLLHATRSIYIVSSVPIIIFNHSHCDDLSIWEIQVVGLRGFVLVDSLDLERRGRHVAIPSSRKCPLYHGYREEVG